MKWAITVLAAICLCACSRNVYVPVETVRTETVQTERTRTDTIERWRDRVVERKGDTVYVTDVRYLRDVKIVTDSIVIRDSIMVEVPIMVPSAKNDKSKGISKWCLLPLIMIIGVLAWKAYWKR